MSNYRFSNLIDEEVAELEDGVEELNVLAALKNMKMCWVKINPDWVIF